MVIWSILDRWFKMEGIGDILDLESERKSE